jgi:hypothetical protein
MLFSTEKKESSRSRKMRWVFNFWPCIFCSGGWIQFISSDFRELHVSIKLNWRNRNRVNTVYGGSIYSSVDPYYMLLFMEVLGKSYVVWDKGATIKFIRPIVNLVKCRFLISEELIEEVKNKVAENGEYNIELPLQYEDNEGSVYAVFTKSVYIAEKSFYKNKQAKRQSQSNDKK